MTEVELSWVAGLLEGEGSFSIVKDGTLKLSCSMTDKDVLYRLHALAGGNVYDLASRGNNKPIYSWSLHRRLNVIDLCKLLLPYMGLRRSAKIRELLQFNIDHPLKRQVKNEEVCKACEG